MPIIKSAKKAARQSVKRRSKNQEIKKVIRNALKEFRNNPNAETMTKVQSEYDKAVKKGLMKKNTASRRKAKLAAYGKKNSVKLAGAAKKAAPAKKAETTKKAPAKKPAAKKASKKTEE